MEEKENVYMTTQTAQTAEAEESSGATDLGKFKDVDALMKAYNALQAEFTRRSQRLRALESAADNSSAEGEAGGLIAPAETEAEPVAAEIAIPKEPSAVSEQGESAASAAQYIPAGGLTGLSEDELYEAVRRDEKVRSRVIGEYLTSLSAGSAPLMRGGTGSPAVAQKRPADFREAGKMALQFFKNGN